MEVGELIDGRYRVVGSLGSGSGGTVYEVEHVDLGSRHALKLLAGSSPLAADRFLREARIAAALDDPHIVRVSDFGRLDGRPYLVMERLVGATLGERLRAGEIGLRALVEHALGILDGLAAAHAAGIVHRDLKPDNVFLVDGPSGPFVKLLDLGVAKLVKPADDLETADGVVVGTPRYVAPEQIAGGGVDHRADLYALGVLLFEGLSGKPPFRGASASETLRMHIVEPPPPLRFDALPGELHSEALAEVILEALAKAPDDRPPSAEAMRARLAATLVGGAPAPLPRPTSSPRPDSSPPRPVSLPPRPTSSPPRPDSSPPRPDSSPPRPDSSPPRPDSSPPRPTSSPPRPVSSPPRTASSPPRPASSPPRPASSPPRPTSSPPRADASAGGRAGSASPPASEPPHETPPLERPGGEPRPGEVSLPWHDDEGHHAGYGGGALSDPPPSFQPAPPEARADAEAQPPSAGRSGRASGWLERVERTASRPGAVLAAVIGVGVLAALLALALRGGGEPRVVAIAPPAPTLVSAEDVKQWLEGGELVPLDPVVLTSSLSPAAAELLTETATAWIEAREVIRLDELLAAYETAPAPRPGVRVAARPLVAIAKDAPRFALRRRAFEILERFGAVGAVGDVAGYLAGELQRNGADACPVRRWYVQRLARLEGPKVGPALARERNRRTGFLNLEDRTGCMRELLERKLGSEGG